MDKIKRHLFNNSTPSREMEPQRSVDEEENETESDSEDTTCCHRMTICHPFIRNINVTSTIFRLGTFRLTWGNLFALATNTALVVLGWVVLYSLLGDTMLPKKDGFGLYFLAVFSYVLGWGLSYIPYLKLPPIFGMLLAGVIVRNCGIYNIRAELGLSATAKIRTFCLSFLMIRAGLQLSTMTLKTHPMLIIALGVIPCSVEMVIMSLCCKGILLFPWDWAAMTGSILSGMSPVVAINNILGLAEKGYGEDKGLATMICTAACIDNVHIVPIFVICYSIVFANDKGKAKMWFYIPAGLRDFILGILTGLVLGILFTFFPHRGHKYVTWLRMAALVLGSLMCTAFTATMAMSSGGYLACVVMSFIAITGWRILSEYFDSAPFRKAAYVLWHVVQPILAGVMGADIAFTEWSVSRSMLHLLCLLIGITARSIAAYVTTLGTRFTWKERLFVVVAWLPKGSLQAGLGPLAFERLSNGSDFENIEMALDIVGISVIAVLLLAPLGAFLATYTGPILLNKVTIEEYERQRELSYLRILSLQPLPTLEK